MIVLLSILFIRHISQIPVCLPLSPLSPTFRPFQTMSLLHIKYDKNMIFPLNPLCKNTDQGPNHSLLKFLQPSLQRSLIVSLQPLQLQPNFGHQNHPFLFVFNRLNGFQSIFRSMKISWEILSNADTVHPKYSGTNMNHY